MSVKDTPKKSGIQSLSRAVDILETVAGNRDGIGLADICKQVGLHTSTAHHHLDYWQMTIFYISTKYHN